MQADSALISGVDWWEVESAADVEWEPKVQEFCLGFESCRSGS
jgi:hypothetical protein